MQSDGQIGIRDYAHARHAGNHGDVLKHVALAAVLAELARSPAPLLYLESHAGDGLFPLGSSGEWGEGISRLWDLPVPPLNAAANLGTDAPPQPGTGAPLQPGTDAPLRPIEQYRAVVGRFSPAGFSRPKIYPGSPLIAQALLDRAARSDDELRLFELEPQAAKVLRTALQADGRAQVFEEEGLKGVARALAENAAGQAGRGPKRPVVLIDPPYSDKAEWTEVARAVPAIFQGHPTAAVLLWYPIRAMTRPVALLNALAQAGVHGTTIELIATPLRLKREKLNGSGLALFHAPDAALRALCADLPDLGTRLGGRGEWTVRLFGF